MTGTGARLVTAVSAAALSLGSGLVPRPAAATVEFYAFHAPPGLVQRGETVRLFLDIGTTDAGQPTGGFFVRDDPQASFTRLPLFGTGGEPVRVPGRLLDGNILEDYVVVHDSGSQQTIRVPAQGAYRSWVRDSYRTIALGTHRFGDPRRPGPAVARADAGSGPGQVGYDSPTEGPQLGPTSFDVGPRGRVWVVDAVNSRLLGWEATQPTRPSRTIDIPYGLADLAVGPDGRVYVSGTRPGTPMTVFAYTPDGRLLWRTRVLSDLLNAHLRIGRAGVLYSVDDRLGWAPVTDPSGNPLSLAQQRSRARAYEPLDGNTKFVFRSRSTRLSRAGLATDAGRLLRTWQVTSDTPLTTGVTERSTVVAGNPVLLYTAWGPGDSTERVVVHLDGDGGVRALFSLPCCPFGDTVTSARVGADDRLYRMASSPVSGLRIFRYPLG